MNKNKKQQLKNKNVITKTNESTKEIIKLLSKLQMEEVNSKRFIFNWKEATEEHIEMIENTRLFNWLKPIKFETEVAIILEAINKNVDNMIEDRDRTKEIIYLSLNLEKNFFDFILEKIQKELTENRKVKICSDGRVIINNLEMEE